MVINYQYQTKRHTSQLVAIYRRESHFIFHHAVGPFADLPVGTLTAGMCRSSHCKKEAQVIL
jgi:hypothetical protein